MADGAAAEGDVAGEPDGGSEHESGHSLRELFRERRIALETMDRPLRLATAGALASLLGVCLLIALRDIPSSGVYVGRTNGISTVVPMPLFVATLVVLSAGFAYLLTGVTMAGLPLALGALALITAAIGTETGTFGHFFGAVGFLRLLPAWAQWLSRGLLVAVWATAFTARWLHRRGGGRQLRLTILAVFSLIFGGWFTVLAVATPTVGGLNLYGEVVDDIMLDLVLLVFPVLQVAAVDFGEWGGLVGDRLAALGRRGRSREVWLSALAAVTCGSLLVFGYLNLVTDSGLFAAPRLRKLGEMLLIAAVLVAIVVVVGRAAGVQHRRWPPTLSVASIFAVTAFFAYLASPLAATWAHAYSDVGAPVEQVSGGQFTAAADVVVVRGGHGDTAFSMLVPRGWLPLHTAAFDAWTNYAYPGAHPGAPDTPMVRVAVASVPQALTTPAAVAAALHTDVRNVHDDAGWLVAPAHAAGGIHATLRVRTDPRAPGHSYLLYTFVRHVPSDLAAQPLEAIAHSFRPAGAAPATLPTSEAAVDSGQQRTRDRILVLTSLIGLALAAALLAAYRLTGRRWGVRVLGSVLLLGLVCLCTIAFFGDAFGRVFVGPQTSWPYISQYGVLCLVGIGGIGITLFAGRVEALRRRGLLTGVVALGATVWALQGMAVLYDHALNASRISVWAAIIVLVAMAWDVTMSGESMTNHGTARTPRATRVLAFLGYVLLLAATVLFYSGQRAATSGAATEAYFEPESVTRDALFRIGLPVALLLFGLRMMRSRRGSRVTDEPVAEAPAEVVTNQS